MHEINVVPYVDVMLVLLVIFMVTAPFVAPGLVELPSVGRAPAAPAAPLEVVVREDGTLLVRARDTKGATLEERRVARSELAGIVAERQRREPELPVVIAADRNVRYEAVVQVLDELQKNAVRRVGLLVRPTP